MVASGGARASIVSVDNRLEEKDVVSELGKDQQAKIIGNFGVWQLTIVMVTGILAVLCT